MSNKKRFDEEIKRLLNLGERNFGYTTKTGKKYNLYFNNKNWNEFKSNIDQISKEQYEDGSGDELEEKKGKWGWYPPKMASVASSSRFIYLLFRNKKNLKIFLSKAGSSFDTQYQVFAFEKKGIISLKNDTKTMPNYDGYYESDREYIYFEAKCHEVFDSHKLQWKKKYGYFGGPFFGNPKRINFNKSLEVKTNPGLVELKRKTFCLTDDEKILVDVKQLVCHILGIAERPNKHKRARLVYLYYRPAALNNKFGSVFSRLEKQMKVIKNSPYIQTFCHDHKISIELYYSINNKMDLYPATFRKII